MMGWPSLFAAVVILGGMQLIATSVIGEYIARIYVQAQARPLYNVAERLNFDAGRRRTSSASRPCCARDRACGASAPASAPPAREGRARDRLLVVAAASRSSRSCARRSGGASSSSAPTRNPRAVAVALCDEFHEVSTDRRRRPLRASCARARADAVTTTGSEVSLKATAQVAARLGLPFYADPETVRRCQDKDAMRAAYAAAGLAVPAFARCATLDEARAFARGARVSARRQAVARLGAARRRSRRGRRRSSPRAFEEARAHSAGAGLPLVVVEAWLDGPRVLGQRLDRGRAPRQLLRHRAAHRRPASRPLGVMIAEVYPSGLSADDEARVVDEARRGAAALGHVRGPCYSQVALGPRGCFLFETAARLGGGFDADVTRLASGVDLYDRVLGVALGDARRSSARARVAPLHGGAIAKFLVARPGLVTRRASASTRPARSAGVDDVAGVRPRRRSRPSAHRQREARGVRARARQRRAPRRPSRADAALARVRIETQREPVRRRPTTFDVGSRHQRHGFARRVAALQGAANARRASTAYRRTGTRAPRRAAAWRARSGRPTRSTRYGTSGSARSSFAPSAT